MVAQNKIFELKQLIKSGEGYHLEFKLKTTHPEKIMREVVAFANSEGGLLLLGVADSGEVKGLKYPDEDRYVMEKSFARYVSPAVDYSLKEIMLENGRPILAYNIKKSKNELIYFNLSGNETDLKVFIRKEDQSVQASKEMREVLKQRLKQKSYRFSYGEKENILIKHLDRHQKITLAQFASLANIPLRQASKTLVLLVLAGVIAIHPGDHQDYYTLKPTD